MVEPGLVREQLLKYRLIMQAGPSLAISDVLAGRHALAADLILSGYVFDYQDQSENPKIDFATPAVFRPGTKNRLVVAKLRGGLRRGLFLRFRPLQVGPCHVAGDVAGHQPDDLFGIRRPARPVGSTTRPVTTGTKE